MAAKNKYTLAIEEILGGSIQHKDWSIFLKVAPTLSINTDLPTDTSVTVGNSKLLSVRVFHESTVTARWYKGNALVNTQTLNGDGTDDTRISATTSAPGTEQYRCELSNAFGTVISSKTCTVRVVRIPPKVTDLKLDKRWYDLNDDVTISGIVTSESKFTYKIDLSWISSGVPEGDNNLCTTVNVDAPPFKDRAFSYTLTSAHRAALLAGVSEKEQRGRYELRFYLIDGDGQHITETLTFATGEDINTIASLSYIRTEAVSSSKAQAVFRLTISKPFTANEFYCNSTLDLIMLDGKHVSWEEAVDLEVVGNHSVIVTFPRDGAVHDLEAGLHGYGDQNSHILYYGKLSVEQSCTLAPIPPPVKGSISVSVHGGWYADNPTVIYFQMSVRTVGSVTITSRNLSRSSAPADGTKYTAVGTATGLDRNYGNEVSDTGSMTYGYDYNP